jgi:hypothetical protein
MSADKESTSKTLTEPYNGERLRLSAGYLIVNSGGHNALAGRSINLTTTQSQVSPVQSQSVISISEKQS